MRGDSGVAGEGRVVGVPKLHSWGKCTMPLTNSTQIELVSCPTRARLPARSDLVNEVKILGLIAQKG